MLGLSLLIATLLVGVIDSVTPADVEFALFYVLPVLAAAWWVGRWWALATAVTGAAVEFAADVLQRQQTVVAATWNSGSRLVIFIAAALLVERLRHELRRHDARDAERSDFLGLLEREFPRPLATMRSLARGLNARRAELPDELRSISIALQHQIDDLDFLATDLLAIGHLQAGHVLFQRAAIDLRTVVRAAVTDAPERDRLVLTGTSDEIVVTGDEDRVRHAIASVIARALDAGSRGVIELFVRQNDVEGLVEVSVRGTITESDLALPRLVLEGQSGRLAMRRGDGRLVVTLALPRAEAPTLPQPPEEQVQRGVDKAPMR
jgi:signal transduction histidine kinase